MVVVVEVIDLQGEGVLSWSCHEEEHEEENEGSREGIEGYLGICVSGT